MSGYARLGIQHTITCKHLVEKLDECHKSSRFARFTNICDDIRIELERCLREEYKQRRDENKRLADERMERYGASKPIKSQ